MAGIDWTSHDAHEYLHLILVGDSDGGNNDHKRDRVGQVIDDAIKRDGTVAN